MYSHTYAIYIRAEYIANAQDIINIKVKDDVQGPHHHHKHYHNHHHHHHWTAKTAHCRTRRRGISLISLEFARARVMTRRIIIIFVVSRRFVQQLYNVTIKNGFLARKLDVIDLSARLWAWQLDFRWFGQG